MWVQGVSPGPVTLSCIRLFARQVQSSRKRSYSMMRKDGFQQVINERIPSSMIHACTFVLQGNCDVAQHHATHRQTQDTPIACTAQHTRHV